MQDPFAMGLGKKAEACGALGQDGDIRKWF
jgi:hypothetical protein